MDAEPGIGGTDRVRWELREGVAILSVANPPVNALVQPVRAGLSQCLTRAIDDPEVAAILIRAEGRTFPAGADVREYTGETGHPTLAVLCDAIETCPKPVVAAIQGTALGGGLELALACHYRIADQGARFGFPEVSLGLVPAAGGTQRLPRLIGARGALDMLFGGRPIDAKRALAFGLIDKIVQQNLDKAGFGSARNMGEAGTPPRPSREETRGLADPAGYPDAVNARRKLIRSDRRPAVARLADLVEAALLLPFEAGLDMERVAYEDLVNSDSARALRHAFLAERRAGRSPALARVDTRPISSIGVVGAGPLAREVAIAALKAGVPVTLALEDDPAIQRARGRIEAQLARAVEAGRIQGKDRDDRLARFDVADSYGALGKVDVVIEALPEDAVRKADTLARIGAACPDALLASSTAECDIEALASASQRPKAFAALHFAPPADRNRLVEIAAGARTEPETVATLVTLARAMGKAPLLSQPRRGLVLNRLVDAYYTAAALLFEQGAAPLAVDQAMQDYGMHVGPFQAQDIAGLDVIWGLRAEACASEIPLQMLENAWYGSRTGQGFYRHGEDLLGETAAPDVLQMVAELRAARGIEARHFTPEEIVARCVYAMANEGARLVEAGVVNRPSDVDAALLIGLGFPRDRGGAMLAADLAGAVAVRKALVSWSAENAFWTPSPIWTELAKYGQGFEDLD